MTVMTEQEEFQTRVLRNELAIIIGCADGRSAQEKAEAVISWMDKHDRRATTIRPAAAPAQAAPTDEAKGQDAGLVATAPEGEWVLFWWVGMPNVKVAPSGWIKGELNPGLGVWDGNAYRPVEWFTHWRRLPPGPVATAAKEGKA